jgi:hypothetical protein
MEKNREKERLKERDKSQKKQRLMKGRKHKVNKAGSREGVQR